MHRRQRFATPTTPPSPAHLALWSTPSIALHARALAKSALNGAIPWTTTRCNLSGSTELAAACIHGCGAAARRPGIHDRRENCHGCAKPFRHPRGPKPVPAFEDIDLFLSDRPLQDAVHANGAAFADLNIGQVTGRWSTRIPGIIFALRRGRGSFQPASDLTILGTPQVTPLPSQSTLRQENFPVDLAARKRAVLFEPRYVSLCRFRLFAAQRVL